MRLIRTAQDSGCNILDHKSYWVKKKTPEGDGYEKGRYCPKCDLYVDEGTIKNWVNSQERFVSYEEMTKLIKLFVETAQESEYFNGFSHEAPESSDYLARRIYYKLLSGKPLEEALFLDNHRLWHSQSSMGDKFDKDLYDLFSSKLVDMNQFIKLLERSIGEETEGLDEEMEEMRGVDDKFVQHWEEYDKKYTNLLEKLKTIRDKFASYVPPRVEDYPLASGKGRIIKICKPGKIMNQPHGKNPSGKLDSQIFLEKEDPQHVAKRKRKGKKKKESDAGQCSVCTAKKKSTEEAESFEYNPWAVCHTTVDKDKDPEKYERCVKKVKNQERKKLNDKED